MMMNDVQYQGSTAKRVFFNPYLTDLPVTSRITQFVRTCLAKPFLPTRHRRRARRFDEKENVGNVNVAKSSVVKGIRSQILDQFENIDNYLDQILPKKEPLKIVKCHDHIELFCSQTGEILFFRQRDGPLFPTLKLLHKYPFILPHMQVDKGAIRFVLSGANIMCPGLTSPGARMTKVDQDRIVAIMAEGKQHALAIGYTKLSTEEIIAKNKGVGVDNIHFLNDGLWVMKTVK